MKCIKLTLGYLFVLVLGGCSLMLDPTDCASDSDCADGTCVSGICVLDTVEPDMMSMSSDMDRSDVDVVADMETPDMAAPDAALVPDMLVPTPDMMIQNEPPQCRVTAAQTLVGTSEARLTIQVTDEDNDVNGLEVSFNDNELTLDENGLYEGVFLLQEGANDFRLVAVSNGQTCDATVTVTSDQTSPRIVEERPSIGETLKSGNGRVFVTATVIEEHFSPDLSIFVNGMPYEISPDEVDWNEQTYILELELERGFHDVEVLITDQVGNVSRSAVGRDCSVDSCVHSFTVDVDSEPPTIVLDSLQTDVVNRIPGRSVQLVGTVIDDEQPVAMAMMELTVTPEIGSERIIALRTDNDGRFDQSIDVLDEVSSSASIELCAEDIATNRGCITIEVEKQLPCVAIDTPLDNVIFPSASVNVSGTICDGVDRLEFRRNGVSVNFISVTGQESFSQNLILPTNGTHEIQVIAINDALGETADDTVTISRDDSPPLLAFTKPTANADGSATCTQSIFEVCVSVSDQESGVSSLRLGSTQIPPNQIVGTVCRQTSVPTGQAVTFSVEATNGAGSVTTRSVVLNVDDRAPFVTFTKPTGIQPINPWIRSIGGQIEIAGTIDSGLCGVDEFFINGAQINVSQAGTFQRFLTFPEGQQTVIYEVSDAAGNRRESNHAFRVDDTNPTISVVNNISEYTNLNTLQLFVAANDDMSQINTTSLRINGDAYELTSVTPTQAEADITVGLTEGVNNFNIVVEDTVGNTASTSISIIRDTTAPTITIESPEEDQAISAPAVVRGTIDDGETGIGGGSVTVNGVEAVIDVETNTWVATNVPIEPTIRNIEVSARDGLGNQSALTTINVGLPEYAQYTGTESGIPAGALTTMAIHTADLNGDGLVDIVELNDDEGRCLIQQDDHTFVQTTGEACGLPDFTGYRCSQMGDMDGDGRLDLVYFDSDGADLLLGGGDGTFLSSGVNMIVDGTITDCQLVDIDRNGRLDIIAIAPENVYILFANDANEFDLEQASNLGLEGLSAYANLEAVDLNNDGFMDLVASGGIPEAQDGDPAGMTILQGSFGGAFQEVSIPGILPHAGGNEFMVLPVDADQDGVLELVLLGQTTILFDRDPNDGGTFDFVQNNQLQASFADQKVLATGDANADGRDDLLFFGDFGTWIIQNFGGGLFGQLDNSFVGLGSLGPVHRASILDLDNDGDEDWILGTSTGLQIWKSNRVQRDPNYRFVRVEIRRYQEGQVYTPIDTNGPNLVLEMLTQQELDEDEGLLVSISNERAMMPRLNVPTIITLGSADGVHIEVRYVDKGLIGSRLKQVTGLPAGESTVVHARE